MEANQNNILQVCHGKKEPLSRMKKGDVFFIYSPKVSLYSNEKYQRIIACGIILDDLVFKYKMSETFEPFRRKVKFYDINEVGIEFLRKLNGWKNYIKFLRYGLFEIDKNFAQLIYLQAKKIIV